MSYYIPTGAITSGFKIASATTTTVAAPETAGARGDILVWEEGPPGYWRRPRAGEDLAGKKTKGAGPAVGGRELTDAEKKKLEATRKHEETCRAAGISDGFIGNCVAHLESGKSIEDYVKAHQQRETREHRPKVLVPICLEAGIPEDLVPICVEGLASGASIEEVVAAINELTPEQIAELTGRPIKKFPILLVGGVAAAGLVALLVWRRRKKKGKGKATKKRRKR